MYEFFYYAQLVCLPRQNVSLNLIHTYSREKKFYRRLLIIPKVNGESQQIFEARVFKMFTVVNEWQCSTI